MKLKRISFLPSFFLIVCVLIISTIKGFAQKDSMSYKGKFISVITKFADADLPPALVNQIRNYSKEEIIHMKEEFQRNVKEDDGEYVITSRLWFEDDHVVGFIKKAPLRNSLQVEVSKTVIDIPIEWCGIVDSLKQPFCVKTLRELTDFAATTKTSQWHQKPDDIPAGAEPLGNAATLKKKIGKNAVKDSLNRVKDSVNQAKGKLSKKELKKQIAESYKNGEEQKDSTGAVIPKPDFGKPKEQDKKKGKGNRKEEMQKSSIDSSSTAMPAFVKPEKEKKKDKKDKKVEVVPPTDSTTAPAPTFGKPEKEKKPSKKDKKSDLAPTTDSTTAPAPAFGKPEKEKKKDKKDKKVEVAPTTDSTAAPAPTFGKPEKEKKKDKKSAKNAVPENVPLAGDSTTNKN